LQQIAELWNSLTLRRRIVVIGAALAMFAAVLGLARMAAAPYMTLLYSGLEGPAAGEIVEALEQRGATYEVRGGSIFVESAERDELRMTLASDGLPRNGGQGYELLDGLTGFGTTSRMFDAAYWRAKEGELARTIASAPHVEAARVHIANAASSPFRREEKPSASVFLTAAGGAVSAGNAKAFRHLVASAVAGLEPEAVSVIDSSGQLLDPGEDDVPAPGGEDRSDLLRQKVQRLLEARVGPANAVVEVTVETVTESEAIRERRFDPQERVAISTETEERSATSRNAGMEGEVTVASNLPDEGGGAGGSSQSQDSETRERVNYEVSEIEREVIRAPGAISRITVAALVNGAMDSDGVLQPRDDAELGELRELVASAIGFDESRGDLITIKSMTFEPFEVAGTQASPGFLDRLALDVTRLIQVAVLAVVALLLGLFVVRPVLTRGAAGLPQIAPPATEDGEAMTGELADDAFSLPELPMISGLDSGLPPLGGDDEADPVARLRGLIGERQEETVEILRTWLDEETEAAR